MKTIIYQGQEIEVERIAWLEGAIDTITPADAPTGGYRSGQDDLYRDAQGRYYLDRDLGDEYGQYEGVHRISLLQVILWSMKQHGEEKSAFRRDMATALAVNGSAVRRLADGGLAVTVPFTPAVAELLLTACRIDDASPVTWVYDAVDSCVRGLVARNNQEDAHMRSLFNEGQPGEGAAFLPGRADLDEEASQILSVYVRSRRVDSRDALNGAVLMALSDGGLCDDEAVARAEANRLEREAKGERSPGAGTTLLLPAQPSVIRGCADGSMTVAVHFHRTPAVWLRNSCDRMGVTPEQFLYDLAGGAVVAMVAQRMDVQQTLERMFTAHRPTDEQAEALGSSGRLASDCDDLGDEPQPSRDRTCRHHPEGMALLAASEPEPVSDEEVAAARAARQGSPEPIHSLLLTLAADWRGEAQDVRGPAAAALERCAKTLEAALNGKGAR